jgi:hypothetical protein
VIGALEVWDELIATGAPQKGLFRRRVLPRSSRDIFLATSHPSLERMLVFRVNPDAFDAITDMPSTRVIRTSLVNIDDAHTELRVSLAAPEMLRVFATFVEDVATYASVEPDDRGVLRAFTTRFAHWRRLLAGEATGGLSRDRAQGLWGELWVLKNVVLVEHPELAVDFWTGADADDKDFRLPTVAVEVKTTRADAPHVMRINGEHQLEHPSGGGGLLLAVLEVESHEQGAGETLNDSVASIRSLLAGAAVLRFDEKLLSYGYADAERALYEDLRYSLRQSAWHLVEPGFPRLTSEVLPEGIGRVTYLLSTDACAPWRIDQARLHELMTTKDRQ